MPSYEMDRQRWAQLSIYEQMGNIGAEVGRAVNATRNGNQKRAQGAIDRALVKPCVFSHHGKPSGEGGDCPGRGDRGRGSASRPRQGEHTVRKEDAMHRYDLLVEGAAVVTMDAEDAVVADGVIGVDGGKIVLLEACRPEVRYQAREVIDARGMVALPGFVNTHVHCFQSLLKGLGADKPLIQWLNSSVQPFGVRVTHRQQELATLVASLEALKSGCTTLCEFFYTSQDPELADVCIETMQRTGIRRVFMRTFQDLGQEYNTPACYIEPVDVAIAEVERLRASYDDGDMTCVWTGPDVTWATSKQGYQKILEYCLGTDVRYTMHLKETPEDDDMCRRHYGMGIVELLESIGFLTDRFLPVHCVGLTERDIALFAEHGVSVSHNPAANLYLGSGIAPIPDCVAAGVNVCLGTDGAASNNATDMLDTMRLAALVHKGVRRDATAMSARQVVGMATVGGARALGRLHELGTLEVGKKADLVLFDPDHLKSTPLFDPLATVVYSSSPENIDTTIVNGKVVYQRGRFACGVDERELAEQVRAEMQGIGLGHR